MAKQNRATSLSVFDSLRKQIENLTKFKKIEDIHHKLPEISAAIEDIKKTFDNKKYKDLLNANEKLKREALERKLTEKALRKSESALKRSQKIAHIGNWETDLRSGQIIWSDEMYRIFGYKEQEIKNLNFDFFLSRLHPEDQEDFVRQRNKGINFSTDFRIISKDGTEKIIRANTEFIYENGKPTKLFGTNRDITSMKAAEAAIIENNERLRKILEVTSDGIWEWNIENDFVEIDERIASLSGLNKKRLNKDVILDMIHMEDKHRFIENMEDFLSGVGDAFDCACRISFEKSVYKWFLVRAVVISGGSGNPSKVVGSVEDISEHKRYNDLKAQYEFQQKLIDAIPFPVFYKNSDGKYLGCNKELHSFFNLEENIIGKTIYELMDGAFNKKEIEFLDKKDKSLFQNNDVASYEADIKSKGKTLRFIVSKALLREHKGHVELIVGAIVDISEIKKTQTELEITRGKLNTILDSMKEVILKYDKDFKVMWANREAYEILGKNENDIVGRYCYELWFKANKPCKKCPIIGAYKTGKKHEGMIKPFNGAIYEVAGYPVIEKNGRISGIVEVALDVTERERAKEKSKMHQEQLFQADKMRALGYIVSGVAHEINNPANYIMINISVMKRIWMDLLPMLSEKIRDVDKIGGFGKRDLKKNMPELLTGIDDGAERIRRTVERLKDYTRESPTDISESFDINFAVFKAVELLKPHIKRSTKNFKLDYGKSIPLVKGDMRRIEQVVVNVIQNACEALGDDTKAIAVKTYFEKNYAVIEVIDEGIGIQPENIALVTEPFFTTKRASGGTGLGLSISSGIMEEHKGKLEIRSEFSKGSSVKIMLPTLK